jgi:hypothetical protein
VMGFSRISCVSMNLRRRNGLTGFEPLPIR